MNASRRHGQCRGGLHSTPYCVLYKSSEQRAATANRPPVWEIWGAVGEKKGRNSRMNEVRHRQQGCQTLPLLLLLAVSAPTTCSHARAECRPSPLFAVSEKVEAVRVDLDKVWVRWLQGGLRVLGGHVCVCTRVSECTCIEACAQLLLLLLCVGCEQVVVQRGNVLGSIKWPPRLEGGNG